MSPWGRSLSLFVFDIASYGNVNPFGRQISSYNNTEVNQEADGPQL